MSSAAQVMHAGEFIFDCLKPMAQAVPGTSVPDRPIPNQGKGSATKEKRTDPITKASLHPSSAGIVSLGLQEKVRSERDSIQGLTGCCVRGLSGYKTEGILRSPGHTYKKR